jgi:hypothetical protein
MVPRTAQPRVLGLHQADRIVLVLLSTVIFAIALLLGCELSAGALNRIELNAVIGSAIALGLIQVWLSLRTVLALTLWASADATGLSGTGARAGTPWALPVWWLGTIPTGWLPLALPGHEHEPPFLALSLVMIAWSARALTQSVQALEARSIGTAPR